MVSKEESFFTGFTKADKDFNIFTASNQIGEKVDVISTGSPLLDDALICGGLPCGRIIQYYGPSGCHAKGQGILMSDGTIKKVEEIEKGDILAGPSGQPRRVICLRRGKDKMFKIIPNKGKSFVVNENHILTLFKDNSSLKNNVNLTSEIIDVSLKEYLGWDQDKKISYKIIRTSAIEKFYKSDNIDSAINSELPIDPYILGVLIGNADLSDSIELTVYEPEIVSELNKFAEKSNLNIIANNKYYGKYRISKTNESKNNDLRLKINDLKLNVKSKDKFIPEIYKQAPIKQRLEVLAGILDIKGKLNTYNFQHISKSEKLANDITYIARSLGLAAYVSEVKKLYKNDIDIKYKVTIKGNCSIIPTRVIRKNSSNIKQIKDALYTGFKVEYVGEDDFYGFTLTEDGRYLLDDFTITHNCGKTLLAMLAIKSAQQKNKTAKQLWIDAEESFDVSWAESLGIDTDRLTIIDGPAASNGRKVFELLIGTPKKDAKGIYSGKSKNGFFDEIALGNLNYNLAVLDSLGQIIPPGEDVSEVGKVNMSLMARFLSQELKKVSVDLHKANIPFIVINHVKDNMNSMGMPSFTFSGGNTLKHGLGVNVFFTALRGADNTLLNSKEDKIGHVIRAKVEKNKLGPWPRQAEFKVNFYKGIDAFEEEVIELAIQYEFIKRVNNLTYSYDDKNFKGKGALLEAFKSNTALIEELHNKIIKARDDKWEMKRQEQNKNKLPIEEVEIENESESDE